MSNARRSILFFLYTLLFLTAAVFLFPDGTVIPIEGEIDKFRQVFIRRSIDRARDSGSDTIIFTIDTFGGRVDSALQIATLIGSLDDIRTVAFIPAEPESLGVSWSAGALISFACSAIYMAPGTSLGAAAPVYMSAEGVEEAGEKTVSAVRAQLAALAEKNGYPKEIAIAMVDQDARLLETGTDEGRRFVLSDDEEADGRVISPKGKLLTLTAGEMEEYGISSGTVSSIGELQERLGIGRVVRIEPSGADRVVGFLASAAVSSILLTIGLIALYLEITSPGFGVPGTVSIIAFAVLFFSGGMIGTLESLELLMFLLGVALLAVEVFLIPGFGITGISGLLLMAGGLVLSRQSFVFPEGEWQWELFARNVLLVFGTFVLAFLLMGVIMIFFPRIPLFRRLILNADPVPGPGGTSSEADTVPLTGSRGIARTHLRPVGRVDFDGEEYPVLTGGEWIEAGSSVVVTERAGNRIVVRLDENGGRE